MGCVLQDVRVNDRNACIVGTLWSGGLAACPLGWCGLAMQCNIAITFLFVVIKLISSLDIFVSRQF